jgi:replicative DNA helicase
MSSDRASKIIPLYPASQGIPYSHEAEESVIGSVLLNPSVFDRCQDLIGGHDTFFSLSHSYIWEAMETAAANGQPVGDMIILCDLLKKQGHLNDIGGPAFLTQLVRNTPTATHAEVYAGMVQRTGIRRRLLQQLEDTQQAIYNQAIPTESLDDYLQHMQQTLDGLTTNVPERVGLTDLAEYHGMVSEAMRNPEKAKGITTGFHALDDLIDGHHKSKLTVVGGLPFTGKTATLIAFALHAAMAGTPTAYYNVADGTKQDVIGRMIAHLSSLPPIQHGVQPIKQATGTMTPAEHTAYMAALSRFSDLPLYVFDQYGMSPRQIALSARTLRDQCDLGVILIDYYQRMGVEGQYPNRLKELEKISSLLVQLAKRLDLPIIVGAQVGHQVAERRDHRPTLSDIKDCKAMAANADVVIFPHREAMFDNEFEFPNRVDFIVAKNKVSGQSGTAMAYIDKAVGAIIPGVVRDGLTHERVL